MTDIITSDTDLCTLLRKYTNSPTTLNSQAASRIEELDECLSMVRSNLESLTFERVHPQQEILTIEQIIDIIDDYKGD